MSQTKTISINKNIPQALIVGLLLGFLTVFVVEHFGKVSYIADTSMLSEEEGFSFTKYIPNDTPVSTIFLDTPLGSKLRISGNGYTVSDVGSSYGSFNDYSNKLKYYIKAVFEDAIYLLYFSLIYAALIVLFMNFRVRLI